MEGNGSGDVQDRDLAESDINRSAEVLAAENRWPRSICKRVGIFRLRLVFVAYGKFSLVFSTYD